MVYKKGSSDFKLILAATLLLILVGLFVYSTLNSSKPKQITQTSKLNYFASLDGKQLIFENAKKDNLEASTPTKTDITIYQNSNLGFVRKTYSLNLKSGTNYITVPDISSYVDTSSISISDQTDPEALLLGQTYVTGSKTDEYQLLQDSIGKNITVKKDTQTITGKLLATYPIILQTNEGIVSINSYDLIIFPNTISFDTSKPSAIFAIDTTKSGTHEITITYLTSGLNWQGQYHLEIRENNTDILGLASITNNENIGYKDVSLRLVAGELNRNNYYYPTPYAAAPQKIAGEGNSLNIREIPSSNIFEFKAYDIPASITLQKSSSQQIPLIGRDNVNSTKLYTFQSSSYSNKINTQLLIENTVKSGLGITLPNGRALLFTPIEGKDAYIGETTISNTAADENVTLDAGTAFDLAAKETNTEHVQINKCTTGNTYQIQLRNHKSVPVVITVSRYISEETKITKENYEHTSKSTTEVQWKIPVSANSSSTLTFSTTTNDQYCNRLPF